MKEIKIVITADEAMDRGVWTSLCAMKGINPYAVKEGMMDIQKEIELSEDEACELGLI